MSFLWILFCFCLYQIVFSFADDPVVQLPNGLIRGRQAVTIQNTSYYAFEKIPYAAPPIGKLRFKAPQPVQHWDGVLNTTLIDVMCYQDYDFVGQSEDCLFLNVYTPKLSNDELLPVMFFIHGGAFSLGSSIGYTSDYIIDNGVILVTINYRLGILGFLSTQDDIIPGNNGLKDQLMALEFIHFNIYLFGGDPDKVTIFGQSAGAISIGYQLMNQNTQSLYRGAILQSGSSLMPSGYQRSARKVAFGTGALLNNTFQSSDNASALLEFLQNVDATALRKAANDYKKANSVLENGSEELLWAPVIEQKNPDAFLTQKMYGLLQTGNVVKVPIMIGTTSEESINFYFSEKSFLTSHLSAFDDDPSLLVPRDMSINAANRTKIGNVIRDVYTNGDSFTNHLGDGVRYFSDTHFTRPIIRFAELYSQFAPTYFYQFSYDGQMGHNDLHYDGAEAVGHAEDLFYIFCLEVSCNFSSYPEADQTASQRLIKMWTNFAKYQNPTPEASELLQNITWSVVASADFPYLDINLSLEIKNHPKVETYPKWVELYENADNQNFDTY